MLPTIACTRARSPSSRFILCRLTLSGGLPIGIRRPRSLKKSHNGPCPQLTGEPGYPFAIAVRICTIHTKRIHAYLNVEAVRYNVRMYCFNRWGYDLAASKRTKSTAYRSISKIAFLEVTHLGLHVGGCDHCALTEILARAMEKTRMSEQELAVFAQRITWHNQPRNESITVH